MLESFLEIFLFHFIFCRFDDRYVNSIDNC